MHKFNKMLQKFLESEIQIRSNFTC